MAGWTTPWHLILLAFLVLLLFGGKRLPELGRSLGTGIRELKELVASRGDEEDEEEGDPDD